MQKVSFVMPEDIEVDFVGDFDPIEKIAHIGSIISHEHGAGRKAITAFETWARNQGAKRITAEALRDSLPFWWKMSFHYRDRGGNHIPIWKIL